MKRILYNILLVLFVLFPVSVLADGYVSVSPGSLTIEQGSSKTFTITAYNAIGDVSIKSNNSGVASVSTGEWGTGIIDEGKTKSGTITVNGISVGTTTITLIIDAATFSGDDLSGQTKTITVNVVAKSTPKPTPQPQPSPSPTPTPVPQPTQPSNDNNNNNKTENNLSKNNNIKSLTIDGYKLVKIDNNNYTLTVTNDVTSISVDATLEDSKAKVTGIGAHKLQVGDNNIEVIVTSESGDQNKINIKVTRKDGYYLEDLASVLKNDKLIDADIIISDNSEISKENITEIKDSKKTIRLNYYDKNKKLLYSWSINGKEIKESIGFMTTITYKSENMKEIYKLSNYADGLYINFKHSGEIPTGTKIKLYVGDKFENDSIVNVYRYNDTEKLLDFIKSDLSVIDGYIEFDIEHCSEYFVTMSKISNLNQVVVDSSNVSSGVVSILIGVIIFLIMIIITVCIFINKKLKNYNQFNVKKDNLEIVNDNQSFDSDVATVNTVTNNLSVNNEASISTNKPVNNYNSQNVNQISNNSNVSNVFNNYNDSSN